MRPARLQFTPVFVLTLLLISVAMVFGGGQGALGDTLAQLLALAVMALLYKAEPDFKQWPKASLWVLLPVLPVLVFLLPLPDALTQAGPARTGISAMLTPVVGDTGWQASLSPVIAERSLLWLLPALALYLSALKFTAVEKRLAVLTVLFWIFTGAVLGLAQKAGGLDSALYFYSNTNRGSSVGFFANANHYAIALAAGLPLVWAGLTWLFNLRGTRPVNPLLFVLFSGIAVFFILGFMLSGSRAGLALGMFGCLLMLPSVIMADQHQGAKRWLFGTLAIGLFFTVQAGLYLISLQFETSALEDLRLQFLPITLQAANQFAPLGSGPGSFWYVFPQYDGFLTGNVIVNHAHNDFLELWLEMRWFFAIAALIALVAFLWQGVRIWFRSAGFVPESTLLAQSAWIGLLLLSLHSLVDYPLRTTALSMLAGLFAALLIREQTRKRAIE
jgi:hypothetical protein